MACEAMEISYSLSVSTPLSIYRSLSPVHANFSSDERRPYSAVH